MHSKMNRALFKAKRIVILLSLVTLFVFEASAQASATCEQLFLSLRSQQNTTTMQPSSWIKKIIGLWKNFSMDKETQKPVVHLQPPILNPTIEGPVPALSLTPATKTILATEVTPIANIKTVPNIPSPIQNEVPITTPIKEKSFVELKEALRNQPISYVLDGLKSTSHLTSGEQFELVQIAFEKSRYEGLLALKKFDDISEDQVVTIIETAIKQDIYSFQFFDNYFKSLSGDKQFHLGQILIEHKYSMLTSVDFTHVSQAQILELAKKILKVQGSYGLNKFSSRLDRQGQWALAEILSEGPRWYIEMQSTLEKLDQLTSKDRFFFIAGTAQKKPSAIFDSLSSYMEMESLTVEQKMKIIIIAVENNNYYSSSGLPKIPEGATPEHLLQLAKAIVQKTQNIADVAALTSKLDNSQQFELAKHIAQKSINKSLTAEVIFDLHRTLTGDQQYVVLQMLANRKFLVSEDLNRKELKISEKQKFQLLVLLAKGHKSSTGKFLQRDNISASEKLKVALKAKLPVGEILDAFRYEDLSILELKSNEIQSFVDYALHSILQGKLKNSSMHIQGLLSILRNVSIEHQVKIIKGLIYNNLFNMDYLSSLSEKISAKQVSELLQALSETNQTIHFDFLRKLPLTDTTLLKVIASKYSIELDTGYFLDKIDPSNLAETDKVIFVKAISNTVLINSKQIIDVAIKIRKIFPLSKKAQGEILEYLALHAPEILDSLIAIYDIQKLEYFSVPENSQKFAKAYFINFYKLDKQIYDRNIKPFLESFSFEDKFYRELIEEYWQQIKEDLRGWKSYNLISVTRTFQNKLDYRSIYKYLVGIARFPTYELLNGFDQAQFRTSEIISLYKTALLSVSKYSYTDNAKNLIKEILQSKYLSDGSKKALLHRYKVVHNLKDKSVFSNLPADKNLSFLKTYLEKNTQDPVQRKIIALAWDRVQRREVGLRIAEEALRWVEFKRKLPDDSLEFLKRISGLRLDLLNLKKISSNTLGTIYELVLDIQKNINGPFFKDISLSMDIYKSSEQLIELLIEVRDLKSIKGNDRSAALHARKTLNDLLNDPKKLSIRDIAENLSRSKLELFSSVMGMDNSKANAINRDKLNHLLQRWGDLEPLYTLTSRYRGFGDQARLIPALQQILLAELEGTFKAFKFQGEGAGSYLAQSQLVGLYGEQINQWSSSRSLVRAFVPETNGVNESSDYYIEVIRRNLQIHLGFSQEKIQKNTISNLASDIANSRMGARQAIEEALQKHQRENFPENKLKKIILFNLVGQMPNLEATKIPNVVTFIEQLIRDNPDLVSVEQREQVFADLNEIKKVVNQDKIRNTSNQVLIASFINSNAKFLLTIGEIVNTVSCQSYRTGSYVQALLGYIMDANVQGMVSFAVRAAHFHSNQQFMEVFSAYKRNLPVQADYDGNLNQITFTLPDSKVVTSLPLGKAYLRNMLKLGLSLKEKRPGVFLERDYMQNHDGLKQMRSQHRELLEEVARVIGATTSGSIQMQQSRAPLGQYSDLGGGIHTQAYTVNVPQQDSSNP